MRKSLVSIGFGLLLLIIGIFISNLIIDLNKSEPTYNNNSLTSVYIELVKNDSNKIEIERNGKLQSSNRISIISEVQGIKKKNRNKSFKEEERFNKDIYNASHNWQLINNQTWNYMKTSFERAYGYLFLKCHVTN